MERLPSHNFDKVASPGMIIMSISIITENNDVVREELYTRNFLKIMSEFFFPKVQLDQGMMLSNKDSKDHKNEKLNVMNMIIK